MAEVFPDAKSFLFRCFTPPLVHAAGALPPCFQALTASGSKSQMLATSNGTHTLPVLGCTQNGACECEHYHKQTRGGALSLCWLQQPTRETNAVMTDAPLKRIYDQHGLV